MSRETIATYGSKGKTVRVFVEKGKEITRVQWREKGTVKTKSWPNTASNRKLAKAWAKAFAAGRDQIIVHTKDALTVRDIWERYTGAEFPHLFTPC